MEFTSSRPLFSGVVVDFISKYTVIETFGFSSPLLRSGCRLDSFLKPITPVVQR